MLNENIKNELNDNLDQVQPPASLHREIRNRIRQDTNRERFALRMKLVLTSLLTVAFFVLFVGGFVFQGIADVLQKLPVMGQIYQDFHSAKTLNTANKQESTKDHLYTAVSEDIEVTLTKASYDGNNLTVDYKVKNNTSTQWPDPPANGAGASHFLLLKGMHEFKINGSVLHGGLGDEFKKLSANEYEGQLQIYPQDFIKEDHFTLECYFSEIQGVKGKWNIKIPVTKEIDQSSTFEPNQKMAALGGEIIVKRVQFTPTAIGLETEMIIDKDKIENKNYLYSIVEVGADNGVIGNIENLPDGKVKIITKSTFAPIKDIPDVISVKVYNPSDVSENAVISVPLKKE